MPGPVTTPAPTVRSRQAPPSPRPSGWPRWTDATVLRTEALAGLVVALALIPEAISFSVIAHVDPRVGLFASVTMALTIAVLGGRPAMISAATGAVALVIAPLVAARGIQYLVATVLLAGVVQIALGVLGVARLMRFVPRSVMVGFVNALGILLFTAQVPNFTHVPWAVYPLLLAGIAIIVLLPRVTRAVPAPLVAIVVLTVVTVAAGISVPEVHDKGALPTSLPTLGLPDVPVSWATLRVIGPYAVAVALVGLMESLMTARLVDDITDTRSNKVRETWAQGAANIVTGLFGGMGGCAMIGQTMINVRAGARTRLSTLLAGGFLLVLLVGLGDVVGRIPMAALAAVMIIVAVSTFDWHSLRTLPRMPRSETAVMVVTVVVVVATGDLAIGVVVGVVVAALLFARRVAHLVQVTPVDDGSGTTRTYRVTGALFFASSNDLVDQFAYADDPDHVVVDLSAAQVWDASTVAALDAVATRYASRGKHVELVGLDEASAARHARVSALLTGAR